MMSSHRIPITDDSSIGEVRRFVSRLCMDGALDETQTGRAAIVCTEMATNVVRHGSRGEIVVTTRSGVGGFSMELLALDQGKGMTDVGACLRDGHSTAGTSGTGLGAIRRMAAAFDIYSQPQRGTALWARLDEPQPARQFRRETPHFDFGGVSVPLNGETQCGDAWHVLSLDDGKKLRVLLADGLGHGPLAEAAAHAAVETFVRNPDVGPAVMLDLMHRALVKTRGAAGSVVEIDLTNSVVTGGGVGNVSMRLFDSGKSSTLICDNGTLGANARNLRQASLPWTADTVLVMHSDGLASQWSLADYPGLAPHHPSLVAGVLYRDHRRLRDDATVVVVRHRT